MKTKFFLIFCLSLLAFSAIMAQPQSTSSMLTVPTIIPLPFNCPGYAAAVKNADFNNDGYTDILVITAAANQAGCQTLIYLQNPSSPGTFSQPLIGFYPYRAGLGFTAVDVADLDNDGLLDVVLAIGDSLVILHNNSGLLISGTPFFSGSGRASFKLIDIGSDGLPEIIVKNENEVGLGCFINLGNLQFSPFGIGTLNSSGGNQLILGDINQDGLSDVVVMCGVATHSVAIFYNTGTGLSEPQFLNLGYVPTSIASGPLLKGSGDDIACTYVSGADNVLAIWDSQNLAGNPISDICQTNTVAMGVTDFAQNGSFELVQAHNLLDQISIFMEFEPLMIAAGSFSYTNFSVHAPADCLTLGDLNHDGLPDIALADSSLGLILMFSSDVATGVNLLKGNAGKVSVFPNPFQNQITIDASDVSSINIFDQTGQKICSLKSDQLKNVNTRDWAAGVYYIKLVSNQGGYSVVKALKL